LGSETKIQYLQPLFECGWGCEIIDSRPLIEANSTFETYVLDGLFFCAAVIFWRVSYSPFVQGVSKSVMGCMNSSITDYVLGKKPVGLYPRVNVLKILSFFNASVHVCFHLAFMSKLELFKSAAVFIEGFLYFSCSLTASIKLLTIKLLYQKKIVNFSILLFDLFFKLAEEQLMLMLEASEWELIIWC